MRQFFVLLFAVPALAAVQPGAGLRDRDNERDGTRVERIRDRDAGARAGKRDRDDIRARGRRPYRSNNLPPGLAKKRTPPPGLQNDLRRRGELPPGIQKRFAPGSVFGPVPGLPADSAPANPEQPKPRLDVPGVVYQVS